MTVRGREVTEEGIAGAKDPIWPEAESPAKMSACKAPRGATVFSVKRAGRDELRATSSKRQKRDETGDRTERYLRPSCQGPMTQPQPQRGDWPQARLSFPACEIGK